MKNFLTANRYFPFALFAVFFTSFSSYLAALNPAFFNDDSAETITAGFTLGLQHPPGYALVSLVDRLFSLVPTGNPSFRVNLGSAFLSALAVTLYTNLLYRFLRNFLIPGETKAGSPPDVLALATAVTAGFLTAFSKTWWEKSIGAKGGIYILGTILVFLIWRLALERERNPQQTLRLALPAFFLFGLGLTNHWETFILFFPLLLIFFGGKTPDQEPLPQKSWFLFPSFLILGASPLLYLPLRAALHPHLNLGSPDTFSFFIADFLRAYTSGREKGLITVLFQAMNGAVPWENLSLLFHSIMDIQGKRIVLHLADEMKAPTLILGLFGLAAWRFSGERRLWLVFLAPLGLLLISLCWASWIPAGPSAGWMTDAFLLPLNWAVAFLAAAGFFWLSIHLGGKRKTFFGFPMFAAIPLYLFFSNAAPCDQKQSTIPYDYGVNLLKSLPRNSVFFAETDVDYFSLYYLQEVGKLRPDVKMIPTFILFEPWGAGEIESLYPGLGLTASSRQFPDPISRLIFSTSEILEKNRDKIPCAFSFFEGALHRFCLPKHPRFSFRRSGIILELDSPLAAKGPWLQNKDLRTRHGKDLGQSPHPSLLGILAVYQKAGVF